MMTCRRGGDIAGRYPLAQFVLHWRIQIADRTRDLVSQPVVQ
jgi:hypothetical protein